MIYHTRKMVKPGDLNPNGTLFGGRLLEWIDEEAALFAVIQLDNNRVVTKFMSEINFISFATPKDMIEIGIETVRFGKTSLVLRCEVRNRMSKKTIVTIENITFVALGKDGRPKPHNKTAKDLIERIN